MFKQVTDGKLKNIPLVELHGYGTSEGVEKSWSKRKRALHRETFQQTRALDRKFTPVHTKAYYDKLKNETANEAREVLDAKKNYTTHYGIKNPKDLDVLMNTPQFMDNGVYTVHVTFGIAHVRKWATPSAINYNAVGDSPFDRQGYWRMGKLTPFPKSQLIKYQNSALGSE